MDKNLDNKEWKVTLKDIENLLDWLLKRTDNLCTKVNECSESIRSDVHTISFDPERNKKLHDFEDKLIERKKWITFQNKYNWTAMAYLAWWVRKLYE